MSFKTFLSEVVVDKKQLLGKLERELRNTSRLSSSDIQHDGDLLSVRYWGDWVVPDEEEDDGDYDWKVLSPASSKKLKDLITKFEKDNKCKVVYQRSEKCWLEFNIK